MTMRTSFGLAVLLAIVLIAPNFAPSDPFVQYRDQALASPSLAHPLGTDDLGRDIWALFAYGGRWSIATGLGAAVLALAIAWVVGSAAGWLGGACDALLMWLAELFLSLPWLYLLIAARAALPLQLPPQWSAAIVIVLIALCSWARPARLLRGVVLSERERGWVAAALGFGVPPLAVFRRHVLPETRPLLLAQALILIPRFVLIEVTLAFAGAGSGETIPSWGALIVPLKQAYLLRDQWWRWLPLLLMLFWFAGCAWLARSIDESPLTKARIR